jgi:acetylornithine deacetylase/succinyl-diaminopimelate desuccinylase-like protein
MTKISICLLMLSVFVATASAQSEKPNPFITNVVDQVSAKRIEEDIRKLVAFGTRNTNSAQNNPNRGIGAARDWIFNQLKEISISCKGCLQVEKRLFEQQLTLNRRILKPTVITNIFARLTGTTDPNRINRIYVVSAHYDSMCADPADEECDAPGANDDASGVAAVLEMARIMSRYKFDASIIFLLVAGEEQGLLGSTYFAEKAKA